MFCNCSSASRPNAGRGVRLHSLYCLAADSRGYVAERFKERLPKASIGKSCVRFKRLSDLDEDGLRELLRLTADTPYGT